MSLPALTVINLPPWAAPKLQHKSCPTRPFSLMPFTSRSRLVRCIARQMAQARTPKEREDLMAEHMKLMQEGTAMMD